MHVVILGSGVIGVSCAYHLALAGHAQFVGAGLTHISNGYYYHS